MLLSPPHCGTCCKCDTEPLEPDQVSNYQTLKVCVTKLAYLVLMGN